VGTRRQIDHDGGERSRRATPFSMYPSTAAGPVLFVKEYATDPTWAPDGRFVVYSGATSAPSFSLKAATPEAATHAFPDLALTRGARHVAFLNGGRELIYFARRVTAQKCVAPQPRDGGGAAADKSRARFDVRDFDISRDGHETGTRTVPGALGRCADDIPRP